MVNTTTAAKTDDRFSFGKSKSPAAKQYITGNEVVSINPLNNPSEFTWGSTYEFPLPDQPFLISEKNYLKVKVKWQRIERAQRDSGSWQPCLESDANYILPAENFGSAMLEEVVMRQGLDPMETDGFVPRGRYLYENFLLSHSDKEVKRHYAYTETDPALFCYRNASDFAIKSTNWTNYFGGATVPFLTNGFEFNITPHAFPFQYRNRSTMQETLFPNTGNPLTVIVKLTSSYRHLFASQAHTPNTAGAQAGYSNYDYMPVVWDMRLVVACPRFSPEGLSIIRNKSLPPLHYDGTFVKQYSQAVSKDSVEVNFVLQRIPMPNYILIQLYEQDYFTGAPKSDYRRPIYKPKPFILKNTRLRYGNRDLSYQTANFNVAQPESALLRQEILKHSDIFGSSKMDQDYFIPATPRALQDYQQHHYLFSFCSDEKNQTILKPLDYSESRTHLSTLDVGLSTDENDKFPEGKLIISLIYPRAGIDYLTRTGTFAERDLKSLLLTA